MSAYVYILNHKNKPRFKIGKAIDISVRIGQLTYDELDLGRSYALEVADNAAATNLERALHRCFDKWRLSAEDMLEQEGVRFTGYTEWFRAECFDKLISFIGNNTELFDYRVLSPAELQAFVVKPAKEAPAVRQKEKSGKVRSPAISVDDAQGAREQTQKLLPLLLDLLKLCTSVHSLPCLPGSRILKGTCDSIHAETVQDILRELLDQGSYKHRQGWFGIFNSVRTEEDKQGRLTFSVGHIWKDTVQERFDPLREASQALAELPLPIKGWAA